MKQTKQRKDQRYSILKGRSMCPSCEHTLVSKDLIPVVSWLRLKGKCRYCRKPISWQYPAVELLTGLLFVFSYFAWPSDLAGLEWLSLALWLAVVVQLVALAVYDLKWMLLPNRMVAITAVFAGFLLVTELVAQKSLDPLVAAFWGALIAGGLFYALFQLSDGKWIGGGDVKLGAVLGIIVGGPMNAILLLFIASFVGTLISLPLLLAGKAKRTSQLPFGPFLILATFIVMLYGQRIVDWYNSLIYLG